MKRCPQCRRTYADDTLRFCLEDGAALESYTGPDTDATLVMGRQTAGADPPPTEILPPGPDPTLRAPDMDATLRRGKPAATARHQGRPTVEDLQGAGLAPGPARRSTASVVAVTITATVLLLALGGLGVWLLMRDRTGGAVDGPGNISTRNTTNISTDNTRTGNTNSNTLPTPTATPYATPTPTVTPTATPPTGDTSGARKEVAAALDAWVRTMESADLEGHMSHYAETLHTYYLASNVSSARVVRPNVAKAFSKYTNFDVRLTNMQIEVDPGGTRAVATFDKTFTFSGPGNYSGSGLNRFWFEKVGGRWLITGEKDLKTYYINSQ